MTQDRMSLPPRGAWIETPYGWHIRIELSRSPHGERGLKLFVLNQVVQADLSLPPRGAWIETQLRLNFSIVAKSRSPHGERGLKQHNRWRKHVVYRVAPPTGSVD